MPLLAASNLAEFLLGYALHEALEPCENLMHILRIGDLQLRPADQLLDPRQALADEVLAESLVDFLEHQLSEPGVLALARLEDAVDEATLLQLASGNALAHDESLIALGYAQTLDQGARGTALGDEAERREGREEEGVGRAVDEVGEGDEGRREADDGPVEADDEDLGVGVEGLGDVEVEGDEALQPVLVKIGRVLRRRQAADGHIRASRESVSATLNSSLQVRLS